MAVEAHTTLLSTTTDSECRDGSNGSCLPARERMQLARAEQRASRGDAESATGAGAGACSSESCRVRKFMADAGAILDAYFKPAGPRETTELLCNENIDSVLAQWRVEFPAFEPFPFAMIDTTERHTTHPLTAAASPCARANRACFPRLLAEGARAFACVLNTDHIGRGGLHWFAVFVDARGTGDAPWTIEYFNSSGRPPHTNVVRWMARARSLLAQARESNTAAYGAGPVESVRVSRIQHQRSQTECGLYALYYIRCRLDGVEYARFARGAVSDSLMYEFRRHVFREAE